MKKTDCNNRVAARLDDNTYKRLMDIAAAKGVSMTETLKDLINDAPNKIMSEMREVRLENLSLSKEMERLSLAVSALESSVKSAAKTEDIKAYHDSMIGGIKNILDKFKIAKGVE
jgi:hypothetical protein